MHHLSDLFPFNTGQVRNFYLLVEMYKESEYNSVFHIFINISFCLFV